MSEQELELPGGLIARVSAAGVMLMERGRDADFELLEEPLSADDARALAPFLEAYYRQEEVA